jgi:hypothetical protein
MCSGIALALSELSDTLVGSPAIKSRIHTRGGEREARFLYRQRKPLLPVWREGQLLLIQWGAWNLDRLLPKNGVVMLADIEEGKWQHLCPEPVDIPATVGLENGIWFRVQQGMRGIFVARDGQPPMVFMLCETASHYYKIMTRSERMPVLIDERI